MADRWLTGAQADRGYAPRSPSPGEIVRVAYVLNTPRAAAYKVAQMALPQLEACTHGVAVAGIFVFDDNALVLRKSEPAPKTALTAPPELWRHPVSSDPFEWSSRTHTGCATFAQ